MQGKEIFKQVLDNIFKAKNIKLAELTAKIGCSHATLYNSLRGTNIMSFRLLTDIAIALKLNKIEFQKLYASWLLTKTKDLIFNREWTEEVNEEMKKVLEEYIYRGL